MARPGETIENPSTGERITFVRTRDETGGELLEFELSVAPGGRLGGFPHRHPVAERFVVEQGVFASWVSGRGRREHGPGDEIVVPAMRGHFVWNAGEVEARARAEARPADEMETLFETLFGLVADGEGRMRGFPPPLHAALLAYTYDLYAPLVPVALQRPILAVLARIAENRGLDPVHPARPIDPDGPGPAHIVPPSGGPGDLRTARTENFIAQPREDVWRLITDARRYPEWILGASDVRQVETDWPDPGAAVELRHGIRPLTVGGSYTVLRGAEPSELELHVQVHPLLETRKRFDLTATPDGTHVTLFEKAIGGVLPRISSPACTLVLEAAGALSLFQLRRLSGSPGGLRARSAGSAAEMATVGGRTT
jgi:mannose-6-phosphate isomerase-like protein (cupin superfamily)